MDPYVRWASLDKDTHAMLLWLQQHCERLASVDPMVLEERVSKLDKQGKHHEVFPLLCTRTYTYCILCGPDAQVSVGTALGVVQYLISVDYHA